MKGVVLFVSTYTIYICIVWLRAWSTELPRPRRRGAQRVGVGRFSCCLASASVPERPGSQRYLRCGCAASELSALRASCLPLRRSACLQRLFMHGVDAKLVALDLVWLPAQGARYALASIFVSASASRVERDGGRGGASIDRSLCFMLRSLRSCAASRVEREGGGGECGHRSTLVSLLYVDRSASCFAR